VTFADSREPDRDRAALTGYGLLVVRARLAPAPAAAATVGGGDPRVAVRVVRAAVAERLARATPDDAVVAHLDGEAWCVALDVRDDVDALLRADAVVRAFEEPLRTESGTWRALVNVGVALRPAGALRTTGGLLREARTALVQATRLGPGCALVFDPCARHLLPPRPCQRRRRRAA